MDYTTSKKIYENKNMIVNINFSKNVTVLPVIFWFII